nr:hypothetical protein [Tanacetum cinerariifolium]
LPLCVYQKLIPPYFPYSIASKTLAKQLNQYLLGSYDAHAVCS